MLTAVLVSAIVWIIEIVANSAPLFHDELFQDRFNHTFCFEKYPMQDWVAGMNLYRAFLGFLAPWTAMLVAYRGILAAVRCNVSTERQEKAKIQRLALSLILIVLLCFGPYHGLLLVRSIMFLRKPCDCGSEESLFAAYHVSLALTSLNCVADPILYCFVNEGARHDVGRALSALLSAACHKGSSCSPSHADMLNAGSVTMETPLSAKKQPCVYNDVGKSSSYKTELVALKEECLQMTILSVGKWLHHLCGRSTSVNRTNSPDCRGLRSTVGSDRHQIARMPASTERFNFCTHQQQNNEKDVSFVLWRFQNIAERLLQVDSEAVWSLRVASSHESVLHADVVASCSSCGWSVMREGVCERFWFSVDH